MIWIQLGASLNGSVKSGFGYLIRGFFFLCILLLGGCPDPYGLKIDSINYKENQASGVIQFTDLKLYKREALINERRDELSYLNDLLKQSRTQIFEPEIVRELEVITAFSAALGLKFDPAAGLAFEQQSEIASLENQVGVAQLRMQLAQFERDAELLKGQLAQQTEVSQGGSTLENTTEAPEGIEGPDISMLLDKISDIQKALAARLDKTSEAPRKVQAAGPIDLFRDRAAYRSQIKNAINSIKLDELHDFEGNSLFRLQLNATVLPPPENYLDTLGILRMQIKRPVLDQEHLADLYLQWLSHINQVLVGSQFVTGQNELSSQDMVRQVLVAGIGFDLYRIIFIEMPKAGSGKSAADMVPGNGDGSSKSIVCAGIRVTMRDPDHCSYLGVAVPPDDRIANIIDFAIQNPKIVVSSLRGALTALQAATTSGDSEKLAPFSIDPDTCGMVIVDGEALPRDGSERTGATPYQAFAWSKGFVDLWPYLSVIPIRFKYWVQQRASGEVSFESLQQVSIALTSLDRALTSLSAMRDAAQDYLLAQAALAEKECRKEILTVDTPSVPESFEAVVEKEGRISVYEVAPEESVQRVSTAARAADAMALALSLAGSFPGSGIGASGNFAFNRSAVGKADALERSPLVVGFAEPGNTTIVTNDKVNTRVTNISAFGWLLGPKIRLDPEKKQLILAQYTAPYNLYADLSLPAWWPYIELDVYTAWAPDWRNPKTGTTLDVANEGKLLRTVQVPMRHNNADMERLTAIILKSLGQSRVDLVNIDGIEPNRVSACDGIVQFQIWGQNIWRADLVNVGGVTVADEHIRLLPDMRGVQIDVDLSKINLIDRRKIQVTVWTPNGSDSQTISLKDARQGNLCSAPAAAQSGIGAGGPVIEGITPGQISICDAAPVLTISGRGFTNVEAVILGGLESPAASKGFVADPTGKFVQARFDIGKDSVRFKGLNHVPLVIRTKNGAAAGYVVVVGAECKEAGGSSTQQAQNSTNKKEQKISEVKPGTIRRCEPNPKFAVLGENLSGAKHAYFVDAVGTIATPIPKDGKALDVSFTITGGDKKLLNVSEKPLVIVFDKTTKEVNVKIEQDCSKP